MPSTLELVAVCLGVCNIVLLVRRSIWNYPFGIAMVALYFLIFREARLYSDMLLQIFFLVVNAWGWWAWGRAGGLSGPVQVDRMGSRGRWTALGSVGVLTLFWGWGMHEYTNAASPWWDAAVAMGSIASQILLARRKIENWIGWIAVDVVAIGLYASKSLWITAALYALFLVLSVQGWREWRRAAA